MHIHLLIDLLNSSFPYIFIYLILVFLPTGPTHPNGPVFPFGPFKPVFPSLPWKQCSFHDWIYQTNSTHFIQQILCESVLSLVLQTYLKT